VGRRGALEQQREHRHEVRLAAAEAAVDEAAVLLAAVEDLLHVVEDLRHRLLDGRRDHVVLDELLDLVGAGVGLAQLDDEAHRPDVLRARQDVSVADRGHGADRSGLDGSTPLGFEAFDIRSDAAHEHADALPRCNVVRGVAVGQAKQVGGEVAAVRAEVLVLALAGVLPQWRGQRRVVKMEEAHA
jgi:hypothetical protein